MKVVGVFVRFSCAASGKIAHFEISKYNLSPFFESNELDYEDDTIVR
jgi:hypothetical protein